MTLLSLRMKYHKYLMKVLLNNKQENDTSFYVSRLTQKVPQTFHVSEPNKLL